MSQARFQKQQRERAKREKAQAKAARKEERAAAQPVEGGAAVLPPQAGVLEDLAALHRRFDDGDIEFEDFEAAKQELLERLDVG
jgi:Gas vesicle protein G